MAGVIGIRHAKQTEIKDNRCQNFRPVRKARLYIIVASLLFAVEIYFHRNMRHEIKQMWKFKYNKDQSIMAESDWIIINEDGTEEPEQ